jgi:hypothetical protein
MHARDMQLGEKRPIHSSSVRICQVHCPSSAATTPSPVLYLLSPRTKGGVVAYGQRALLNYSEPIEDARVINCSRNPPVACLRLSSCWSCRQRRLCWGLLRSLSQVRLVNSTAGCTSASTCCLRCSACAAGGLNSGVLLKCFDGACCRLR